MAKFTYEVQDMNGKKLRGSVEADSREKVVFALQNKGYIVVDVKEGGGASTVLLRFAVNNIACSGPRHSRQPSDFIQFHNCPLRKM